MLILTSMLLVTGSFINAAARSAGNSYTDAVMQLAGRSILSEYNIPLLERYGIFAFHGEQSDVESKLRYYADYSFHNNYLKEISRKRKHLDPLNLDIESIYVDLKGYSITDADLFESQIVENMKTGLIKNILRNNNCDKPQTADIELKNQKIINSLPSKGYRTSTLDIKRLVDNGIPSIEAIKESGSKNFLVNEYIISNFFNHASGKETRESFFINEVEYILNGEFNDQQNYKDVRNMLFLMRTGLNSLHICSDTAKETK